MCKKFRRGIGPAGRKFSKKKTGFLKKIIKNHPDRIRGSDFHRLKKEEKEEKKEKRRKYKKGKEREKRKKRKGEKRQNVFALSRPCIKCLD